MLKSGCKVEKLRMQKASLLRHAITIHMVTAWRVLLMTLLGRTSPEMEAGVMFTDVELSVLRTYSKRYGLSDPTNLLAAVLLVAIMGGYAPRKNRQPGHTVLWRGYSSLQIRASHHEDLAATGQLVVRPPP